MSCMFHLLLGLPKCLYFGCLFGGHGALVEGRGEQDSQKRERDLKLGRWGSGRWKKERIQRFMKYYM